VQKVWIKPERKYAAASEHQVEIKPEREKAGASEPECEFHLV
jgi:hypothetical protein